MILLEYQGKLLPPHCKARKRQLVAPSSKIIPRGSKCFNFCLPGRYLSGSILILTLRPRETIPKTRAPMGKLLQSQSERVDRVQQEGLHPEAPSPAHIHSQRTAQNWTKTCADAERADNETNIKRALFQRSYVCDDTYAALNKQRSTATGYCPPQY